MSELKGQIGELRATITITRKATGKTEVYQLTGAATLEEAAALLLEPPKVHGASGAMVGAGAKLTNEEQ